MKRCGQWLFVLWVATALLYPQAATAAARVCIETSQLSQSQVQSLPLLADLSFKETGKVETKPCATPDSSEQIQGDTAHRVSMPATVAHMAHVATPVQPVIEAVRGRLPFVCGPPAQN